MKRTVLLLTVLGCVIASPNGYYHQEYNYKTSASSYKNNELQHQTDDQGYYRKDGDLEGRVRPRVDSNSEHSEYVNPNLRAGEYNTGFSGGVNGDLSSYGHMRADVGAYGSRDLSSEGLAHADHITGNRGAAYSGYNSGSYGSSNYGSSSQSYGTSSNLRSVTSHIQQELERDLQRAIQENRAYSSQSNIDIAQLERELRQNLTNRLNTELTNRYGQQSIRGGLSYTISDGRLHSTANYDNRELQDLRTQLENTLLNQLRTQSSSSRYESQQSSHGTYGYTTVRPVYYTHAPINYRTTTLRPTYPVDYNRDNYIRYTPIPNPQSIQTIATQVQTQLDSRLNDLLDETRRRYFSSNTAYTLTNTDVILENLRNELRNNITYLLNEEVKVNYGNQIPRDGYMYSVGPNGQTSNQYNYAIRDLESLRSQIERNLIEKLNRDFESSKSRWYQQSAYSQSSQHSSGNVQYGGYTTPRYHIYTTPQYRSYEPDVEHITTRPASSNIATLITNGGSSSSNRHYNMLAGTSQSGYEISGGSSNIAQLQRQLQQDLSRQLQAAISRGHYGSYSTSGSYNPQSYQTSLQSLTDELNRNLTRQLQEYSASGYYSTHGNIDQAQLSSLRNQLQADLMRQLQQGLQQSYQSSSSYSASSSSSSSGGSYRPARGFENYQSGQYRSGGNILTMGGEDCVGDDPNAYHSHRIRRSYQPYRSQPIGLGYSNRYNNNYGYSDNYRSPYNTDQSQQVQQNEELGQLVDDSDLTQQVEDARYGNLHQAPLGQVVDESDLTQQVEDARYGNLHQAPLGQQVDDSDLTQQVEDSGIGRLQVGSQSQQQVDLGQDIYDPDLTQQVEPSGKLQIGSQSQQQVDLEQQVDDSKLTQQVEDSGLGKLQVGSQNQQQVNLGQQVDDSELTQQVEDSGLGKLQIDSQNQQVDFGQQINDPELTQQVENSGLGRLQIGSHSQQQVDLGQQVEDPELTQQVEHSGLGRLQIGSQYQQQTNLGQQVDDSELTQQVENSGSGKLQLGSHNEQSQNVDDFDVTQHAVNSPYGNLQISSNGQHQTDFGQIPGNSDLTQQVQDLNYGRLQYGSQRQPDQQSTGDSHLTQQVQSPNFGKLQLGSHGQQQIDLEQNVDDTILTGQPQTEQQVNNLDLTQQVEDAGYGKLQLNPQQVEQTQQVEESNQSGLLQSQDLTSYQSPQQISGQEEDNSDLTQQVEDSSNRIQSGSLYKPQIEFEQRGDQQPQDIGRFTSQTHPSISSPQQISGNALTSGSNSVGSSFNQQQKYNIRKLENNLSDELENAVKSYYTTAYSTSQDLDSVYQTLFREFQKNLTEQLLLLSHNRGGSAYSYSFNFNNQQLNLLYQQLENNLKTQLQREIAQYKNEGQQIDQELSPTGQIPDNAVGSSDLQQQQNNFGKLEFGGQTQTRDDQLEDFQQVEDNGKPQLQRIQQTRTDQNLPGQQTQQTTDQLEDLNAPVPNVDPNLQGNHNYNNWPYSSGRLQLGNRPLRPKPSYNNQFIQTEIAQQQNLYPNQDTINQPKDFVHRPNNLPALNSVTDQQQSNSVIPDETQRLQQVPDNNSKIEDTEFGSTQQHLSPQSSVDLDYKDLENVYPSQSFSQSPQIPDQPSQVQQPGQPLFQSNAEAERTADLLIQALRDSQKNRVDQSISGTEPNANKPGSYAQVLSQGSTNSYGHTSQSTDYQYTYVQPKQVYLNERQVQLANQLENDLSKQVQEAVSQSYYIGRTSSSGVTNSQAYQINFEELLKELERNITKELEQTFNTVGQNSYSSYSNYVYGSLTPVQKQKLIKDLQTNLSKKLQHDLQISYQVQQQNNGQTVYHSGGTYSHSYGSHPQETYSTFGSSGSNYGRNVEQTASNIQYGQEQIIPESETVSVIQPIEPVHPTVVQDVEPQVAQNIGVKSHGKAGVQVYPSVPQPPVPAPVQDSEVPIPQPPVPGSPQSPGSGTQEIVEPPQVENVPWWKRFGNKISQGATNLKEKIIG